MTHVFAGLAVCDYEAARAWYERLLGRPPDMLPKADGAVWQLSGTALIYVVADHERAGNGLLTVAVDNLDELLAPAPRTFGSNALRRRRCLIRRERDGRSMPLRPVPQAPDAAGQLRQLAVEALGLLQVRRMSDTFVPRGLGG